MLFPGNRMPAFQMIVAQTTILHGKRISESSQAVVRCGLLGYEGSNENN